MVVLIFFRRGKKKKRTGAGGVGGCVGTFGLFFFLRGKSKLPHPWGWGLVAINGMALAKEGIGCPFWTESL